MYVYLEWDLKLCMVEIRYGKVCSNTNYYIHYNPNSFESHYMVCLPCCSTVCFYVFGNFWESKVRRPPTINKEIKGVVLKPPRPPRPLDFCAICFFRTPKLPQFTISANHAHNFVCRRRLPCLAHHNTGYETEHTHVGIHEANRA